MAGKKVIRDAVILITGFVFLLTPILPAQRVNSRRGIRSLAGMAQSADLFLPAVTYPSAGAFGNAVAVADLNRDGKPDLVVANGYNGGIPGNGGVGVLLGNGDGTFQPAVTYDSGGPGADANSVVIADMTGDGKLDLVVVDSCNDGFCNGGNWVAVLKGNGDGTFRKALKHRSAGASWQVKVADVNGDGIPDLLVANACSGTNNVHTCKAKGSLGVLLGMGKGKFQIAQSYPVNETGSYSLAVGDFNGDGKLDAVETSFCSTNGCTGGHGTVGMFLGNGDGTFQPVVNYFTGGAASAVAVADLNGDGKLDVVVANGGSSSVSVLSGNGDGTLQPPTFYSFSGFGTSITVADVNEDGKLDLIVGNGDYTVIGGASIFLGNGNGTFQLPTTYSSLEYGAGPTAIADVNGDGRPDLLVTNYCESPICSPSAMGSVAVLLHADTP
jgi:hypothetical protein